MRGHVELLVAAKSSASLPKVLMGFDQQHFVSNATKATTEASFRIIMSALEVS